MSKILKTKYSVENVKNLMIENNETQYIIGREDFKPLHKLQDFYNTLKDYFISTIGIVINDTQYCNKIRVASVSGVGFEVDLTSLFPYLKQVKVGDSLKVCLGGNSGNGGIRVKIEYIDGTSILNSFDDYGNMEIVTFNITKEIKKISMYNTTLNNPTIILNGNGVGFTDTSLYFMLENRTLNNFNLSSIIDDDCEMIIIKDRSGVVSNLKNYFSNEELIQLFNMFVKKNYEQKIYYNTVEGINDFFRRYKNKNTNALFELAKNLNLLTDLSTVNQKQESKEDSANIIISNIITNNENDSETNLKVADTPNSITGDLVDVYTTSQNKTTVNDDTFNQQDQNTSNNTIVTREGKLQDLVFEFSKKYNINLFDNYIKHFDSLITISSEEDDDFED